MGPYVSNEVYRRTLWSERLRQYDWHSSFVTLKSLRQSQVKWADIRWSVLSLIPPSYLSNQIHVLLSLSLYSIRPIQKHREIEYSQ
jgi:hypothetical protein